MLFSSDLAIQSISFFYDEVFSDDRKTEFIKVNVFDTENKFPFQRKIYTELDITSVHNSDNGFSEKIRKKVKDKPSVTILWTYNWQYLV